MCRTMFPYSKALLATYDIEPVKIGQQSVKKEQLQAFLIDSIFQFETHYSDNRSWSDHEIDFEKTIHLSITISSYVTGKEMGLHYGSIW